MSSDWTLIGGDPAPGDPAALMDLVRRLMAARNRAEDCEQHVQHLLSGWADGGWQGAASTRFRDFLINVRKHLSDMALAHGSAVHAMAAYATTLESSQQVARRVLGQVSDATSSLHQARVQQHELQLKLDQTMAAHDDALRELDRINARVQELTSAGLHVLADVAQFVDTSLQALFTERSKWTIARALAAEGIAMARLALDTIGSAISDLIAIAHDGLTRAEELRQEMQLAVSDVTNVLDGAPHDLTGPIGAYIDEFIALLAGLGLALPGWTVRAQRGQGSTPSTGNSHLTRPPSSGSHAPSPAQPVTRGNSLRSQAASSAVQYANATYHEIFNATPDTFWCGLFAKKVLMTHGLSFPTSPKCAAAKVSTWYSAASKQATGLHIVTTPKAVQPGDVIAYYNPGTGRVYTHGWAHIGVVTRTSGDQLQAAQGDFEGHGTGSAFYNSSKVILDNSAGQQSTNPGPPNGIPDLPVGALVYKRVTHWDGTHTLYGVVIQSDPR